MQEEWRDKYLPMILDPVDEETYYYPWLYFVLLIKGNLIMASLAIRWQSDVIDSCSVPNLLRS
jgi:hypothetical protein